MDDFFHYRDGELYAEELPLRQLGEQFGTPLYVYSRAALRANFDDCSRPFTGFGHLLCYAVKANGNLAVLQTLAALGAGFDVVSGGELQRVLHAGGEPRKTVFSGVGKTAEELRAACQAGILCINLESPAELELLAELAADAGCEAGVAVRLNPGIEAGGHPHIRTGHGASKFGVDEQTALQMYRQAAELPQLVVLGIACHIGSQIHEPAPFLEALESMLSLRTRLQDEGIALRHVDLGGGFGVAYDGETALDFEELGAVLRERLLKERLELILEPGRRIAAAAGILLTRVLYRKDNGAEHSHLVCDAGMNDLLRPALYDARHPIRTVRAAEDEKRAPPCEVVGPVCESGDVLGRNCRLQAVPGDLLAVGMAGAYAFSMSSQYNARPRAAELMVDKDQAHLVRRREDFQDLVRGEQPLPGDGSR